MSDSQEITDRDETRRLAYVLLAASHPQVRAHRLHELIGTLAHSVAHHAGLTDGPPLVVTLARVVERDMGAIDVLDGVINDLTRQIAELKGDASPATSGEVLSDAFDPVRSALMGKIRDRFEDVARDPYGAWLAGGAADDVMHMIDVALDTFIEQCSALRVADAAEAEVDLAHALDLVRQLLLRPAGTLDRRWLAEATERQRRRQRER